MAGVCVAGVGGACVCVAGVCEACVLVSDAGVVREIGRVPVCIPVICTDLVCSFVREK